MGFLNEAIHYLHQLYTCFFFIFKYLEQTNIQIEITTKYSTNQSVINKN